MTHSARTSIVFVVMVAAATHLSRDAAFAQSTRSPIDIQREAAAALFGPRLSALGAVRLQADADQRKYDIACKDKTTAVRAKAAPGIPLNGPLIGEGAIVSLGALPPIPAMPATLELKNETTPTCRILRDQVKTSEAAIATELGAIEEAARRRGVLPGIMRDLKRAYGVDDWRIDD